MELKKNEVVLLLGSNLGDKRIILKECKSAIVNSVGTILKESSIFESEAWGYSSQFNFLNQVIIVQTHLSPELLLIQNQKIEIDFGRKRRIKKGYTDRPIDIDILFYSQQKIQKKGLTIPHPEIKNRLFTLFPLNEILPNYIHPVFNIRISILLNQCKDSGKVWLSNK